MSAYEDVADAIRHMHGALDKVLAQIPKAEEFWATRDMIDTEKVCLDTFKAEANQARAKVRKAAQDEKEALKVEQQAFLEVAKAAHATEMAKLAEAKERVRRDTVALKAELADIHKQVVEARAALSVEQAKVEMAVKELTTRREAIRDLQASMGAIFQKAM
jgi:chromosome segregation ATPase